MKSAKKPSGQAIPLLIRQDRFPVAVNDLVVVNAGIPHTETSQDGSPMEYVVLGVEGLETSADASGCVLIRLKIAKVCFKGKERRMEL